jgi:hypothetical protein
MTLKNAPLLGATRALAWDGIRGQNAIVEQRETPMGGLHSPMQNLLLAAMPSASLDRLRPHLTLASLARGQVLYEAGSRMSHFYFPTTCIVSLLYALTDGASAEIAVIGKEGLVGV